MTVKLRLLDVLMYWIDYWSIYRLLDVLDRLLDIVHVQKTTLDYRIPDQSMNIYNKLYCQDIHYNI